MLVVSRLIFSEQERSVIADAYRSIGVAFPERGRSGQAADETRVLVGLIAGDAVSPGQLRRAQTVFRVQLAVCREQSSLAYWRRELTAQRTAPELTNPVAGGGAASGVPLVLDGERAARTLAEARERQAEEAAAALELIQRALDALPPEPSSASEGENR